MVGAEVQLNLGRARRARLGQVQPPGPHGSCLDEARREHLLRRRVQRTGSPRFIAPSCADVSPGAGKLGTICEDLDVVCESSNCSPSTGTCAPPRACPASCDLGQYCDEIADGCTPLKADGTACRSNARVRVARVRLPGDGLRAALDDGAACGSNTDCVSGVCILTPSNTASCGSRLGNDAVCVRDEDCASGACVGTAPALTCGAPLPDGARCAADSACVSGNCQTRVLAPSPPVGRPSATASEPVEPASFARRVPSRRALLGDLHAGGAEDLRRQPARADVVLAGGDQLAQRLDPRRRAHQRPRGRDEPRGAAGGACGGWCRSYPLPRRMWRFSFSDTASPRTPCR